MAIRGDLLRAVTATVLMNLVLLAPVHADPGVGSLAGDEQAPPEAEEQDVAQIAADLGLSLEVARERFSGQNDFNRSLAVIQQSASTRYAGAVRRSNEIWLKGQPEPGDAELMNRAFPDDAPVVIYGKKYSRAELEQLTERVHREVAKALPSRTPLRTALDEKQSLVVVTVATPSAANVASKALTAAGERRVVDLADIVVHVNQQTSLGSDHAVQGGSVLSTCTGAFSVTGGVYSGLITAEHCGNTQQYGGQNILTFRAQSVKTEGDMQWHSSSTGAVPRLWATATSYRDVNENLPINVDDGVCRFGKTTNSACGTVGELYVCYNVDPNGYYCNITLAIQSMGSQLGDSGGPVYWGNAALGVWKGVKDGHGAFTRTFNTRTNVLRGVSILEAN